MRRKGIRKVFSERFLRKMLTTRERRAMEASAVSRWYSSTYVGVGGGPCKSLTIKHLRRGFIQRFARLSSEKKKKISKEKPCVPWDVCYSIGSQMSDVKETL